MIVDGLQIMDIIIVVIDIKQLMIFQELGMQFLGFLPE